MSLPASAEQVAAKPSSTQLRALLTRTALLDASLKVICIKGYSATTVDDICTAAVQETFDRHPAIRAACREGIEGHARTLVPMIAQAKAPYVPNADWNAENLALYTQAALQGAFILAKAQGSSVIAVQFIAHLRNCLQGLLSPRNSN